MNTSLRRTLRIAPLALAACLAPLVAACTSPNGDDLTPTEQAVDAPTPAPPPATLKPLAGKRVLILPFTYQMSGYTDGDTNCFWDNAVALKSFYEANRATAEIYRVSMHPDLEGVSGYRFSPAGNYRSPGQDFYPPEEKIKSLKKEESDWFKDAAGDHHAKGIFKILQTLKAQGKAFDRVITLGHAGSDGPAFQAAGGTTAQTGQWIQIGWNWPNDRDRLIGATRGVFGDTSRSKDALFKQNLEAFSTFGSLFRSVLTPTGFFYAGGCNAGEKGGTIPNYSFVEMMSCTTGNHAYGTSSKTSCEDVTKRVYTLEGVGDPTGQGQLTTALVHVDPRSLPAAPGLDCRPR